MVLFYDNWCSKCTRFVKFVKKLDWFSVLTIEKLRDNDFESYIGIDIQRAKKEMASYKNKWNYGYETIYLILIRLPIFIPFLPILYFLKISNIGNKIYNSLAIKRKIIPIHCNDSCSL